MKHNYNGNAFTVYDDELSMLEIVDEHHKAIVNKTDLYGDHKGSWQGISKPTLSEEGMRATVEKHMQDISELQNDVTELFNSVNDKAITLYQDNIHLIEMGGSFVLGENLSINETINISNSIHLNGNGHKILLGRGVNYAFYVQDTENVIFENIMFDCQLVARSVLRVDRSYNILIKNCSFTGYSKEYGYYKIDGAITISNCKSVIIKDNKFYKWGDQYGTSTEDLNRCINIMDNSTHVNISNNTFNKVNQAIVNSDCPALIIANNFFEDVKDNSIYSFTSNVTIDSNIFNDKYDESVVIGGGEYLITNNTFRDIPNKAVAISSKTEFLKIDGNTFINNIQQGQFIVARDSSIKISEVIITNNTFRSVAQNNNNPLLYIALNDMIVFNNNYLKCVHSNSKRCLYIQSSDTVLGEVKHNIFYNENGTYDSMTMTINVPTSNTFTLNDNIIINGRGNLPSSMKVDTSCASNVGYHNGDQRKPSIYWCDSIPSWLTPTTGMRVNKITITSDKIVGWVYDGSTWLKILGTV